MLRDWWRIFRVAPAKILKKITENLRKFVRKISHKRQIEVNNRQIYWSIWWHLMCFINIYLIEFFVGFYLNLCLLDWHSCDKWKITGGGVYNTVLLGLYNTVLLTAITPLTVSGKKCGFDRNNTTHFLISGLRPRFNNIIFGIEL